MKNVLKAAAAVLLAAVAVRAETLEERLDRLERRQAAMEQSRPAVKLSGSVQTDYRAFPSDEARALTDQFVLRRVRPVIEGSLHDLADFRVMPDFAGAAALQDAYVDVRAAPGLKVRAGKFKQPVGLERLQAITHSLFVELAYPSSVAPIRDAGLQLHGDAAGGSLSWALGVFDGAPDGASNESDSTDSKDFAARAFLLPFKNGARPALKELGVGAAASSGKHRGTAAAPGLSSYRTVGQNTFFSYRTDVAADGERTRVAPQAYWYPGRWGLLAEHIAATHEVKRTTTAVTRAELTHRAWQAAFSFVLTGEKASYKSVKPARNFDPAQGGWGAWELAARYTELLLDEDSFPVYAAPASSARAARTWSAGLNWHLNPGLKVMADFDTTRFTGGAAAGDRDTERAVLTRVQVVF
jgi:phosphate-selective porin OprO and OprP